MDRKCYLVLVFRVLNNISILLDMACYKIYNNFP